jgi:mono/diheme cytochrome c family protein
MFARTIFLAVSLAGSASAQEADVQAGRDLYMTYCWQCHGPYASGNGPMAEILAIPTPDLTRLAARNNGEFPLEAIARQIDGRDAVLAHGGEMPIFGPFLDADQAVAFRLPSGQPMMTSQPLADIIVYLESLQEE